MRILLFCVLLALTACEPEKNEAIKNIRWGSNADPLNGLTITWTNNGNSDSIQWGYSSSLEKGSSVANKRNGNSKHESFFNYVFDSVMPNSTIHYKLYNSKTNVWGEAMIFKTAPPADTTCFCFLGMGDSRDNMDVWEQIAGLAKTKNAAFTIFNGDIVADGDDHSLWNNWFYAGRHFLQNNLIYHSMGNHDASNVGYYQNTFDLPQVNGSNLYYSFVYGNALFICLNSESANDTAQYNWLKNTLEIQKNNPKIIWKIAFDHRPFYTIGGHANEMDEHFDTWWKAFDDYGVDIICSGHDHMYERSKPINRNVSTNEPVTTYGNCVNEGRCQIVCGGAGAPLYKGKKDWFIEKHSSVHNFVQFQIKGNSLHGTAYSNANTVIDSFTIVKRHAIEKITQ